MRWETLNVYQQVYTLGIKSCDQQKIKKANSFCNNWKNSFRIPKDTSFSICVSRLFCSSTSLSFRDWRVHVRREEEEAGTGFETSTSGSFAMDRPAGLTSRWGKRYFRTGSAGSKEESKYLLLDGDNDDDVVFASAKVRGRKANKADQEPEGVELLVPVTGRPPTRPPNDQCVEAEIQPEDTLASISLKVLLMFTSFQD